MRGGRLRIDLNGFFETFDCPFVIQRAHAAFAGEKMRFLLLVQLRPCIAVTAAESQYQAKQQHGASQVARAEHLALTIRNRPARFNRESANHSTFLAVSSARKGFPTIA